MKYQAFKSKVEALGYVANPYIVDGDVAYIEVRNKSGHSLITVYDTLYDLDMFGWETFQAWWGSKQKHDLVISWAFQLAATLPKNRGKLQKEVAA